MVETKEKPKIELLQSTGLYTVELCNPVKDQLNRIEVCKPNIVFTPCNPIERIKCIPDLQCLPIIGPCLPNICIPSIWCQPIIWCRPTIICPPIIGGGICSPSVEIPIPRLDEIAARFEQIANEVEALKRRVEKK
ncbi:MAG: hypothetical protein QXI39_04535 [Candidatus Bathyarchaeia archaeon]